MGRVEGTVTLDGVPVFDHVVEFTSEDKSIAPSFGRTDKAGHYEVQFSASREGAVVGRHRVRIRPNMDDSGMPVVKEGPHTPAKYYKNSELVFEVKGGRNTADFSLTSK